jgi:capsular polysaccharide transport system permease protein
MSMASAIDPSCLSISNTPLMPYAFQSASRVWRALYLREAATRLSLRRGEWFWLILEPAEQVAYVVMLHLLIGRKMLPGINLPLFIAVGVLPFMLVRNVTLRGMEGLEANRALLHYRQIKPFDTVLVRALLEATLLIVVTTLLIGAWALAEGVHAPSNPLAVFSACRQCG